LTPARRHCSLALGAAAIEFSHAVVSAFGETGFARSPEAAADMLLNAASKLDG